MSVADGGQGKTALVLPSVMASGTERRLSFVYRHLERRFPGEYLLLVSRELFPILNAGGFGLDQLPGVRLLPERSPLDRKRGAHAPPWINAGRLLTMERYRRHLGDLVRSGAVRLLHPYLELVPYLGLRPIPGVPWIVPVVDHLPKYFDGRSLDCRLLLRAIRKSGRVDALYPWIAERLVGLGIAPERVLHPQWNTVNHEAFHPEPKERLVSFAARTIDWKNPLLMVEVVSHVLRHRPDVRFVVLGTGALSHETRRRIEALGWGERVEFGYRQDPSPIVNRSLIHLSLDRYDNYPNQSLLEGMAAGCAIVASAVGETHRVVTDDVGRLAPLEAAAIGRAVIEFLDRPEEARRCGEEARRRVLQNHHVDAYIDHLRRVHDPTTAGAVG